MLDAQRVYQIIRQIPPGKVATYGQLARLAGHPRHARHIGRLLANAPHSENLPWHRVVNGQGQISQRGMDGSDEFQRILLEEEGIAFGLSGRISLAKYQWQPTEAPYANTTTK